MKKAVIGIIGGNGQMGQYFKSFFEKNGYEVMISGRKTKLTNEALAKKADVVIVSVPIDQTEEVIKKVAPYVKKTGVLMDMTSFKVFPMQAMKACRGSYVGCHPLFGPTANIEGQVIVLCPGRGEKWFNWLKELFKKNKAIVKELTAKKHDELMAYIQALTHFSDIALADTLRKSGIPVRTFTAYESPVYRLELDMMGRILNQDPGLYANIQIGNPLSKKVVKSFMESCRELGETIEKKDVEANIRFFKRCADYLGDFTAAAMEESDKLLSYLGGGETAAVQDEKKKYDLAVLGPQNTYSDMAAKRHAPKAALYYAPSVSEVFERVMRNKVKEGLVPVENTLTGSVRETLDELYERGVVVSEMIAQPVNLALIGIKKTALNKIKTIYSHSQPLLQSRRFIKANCPKAACIPVSSTAAALERVLREKREDACAVGSPAAAEKYGLEVIKKGIEDHKNNTTYFAVIRKKPKTERRESKSKKTSIAFNFSKDAPGSLLSVLQDFADNKINMTKIESRPSSKEYGEYVFYIDFEGNTANANVQKALKQIRRKTAKLKVLGCY